MNGVRGKSKKSYLLARLLGLALLFLFVTIGESYAQSVTITEPVSPRGNRGFGMQFHPIKKTNKFHKGQDYPVNTTISGRGTFSCEPDSGSGYGNQGFIDHACGVRERYAHLSRCSPSSVHTGSTGQSTGVHLHYEVLINGTPVDPVKSFGKNLCDGNVRKELLDDAKNRGGSGGTAGDRASSNSPAPQNNGTGNTVTTVPPSTSGGGVGTGSTGTGGYLYVETPDGRTYSVPYIDEEENDFPPLGATTDQLTQTGQTNNEVTGCATDTWTAMVNQSVMQVRREMMYNQRYVVKPDSMLAYACLEKTLEGKGKVMGILSGTKRWVNNQVDIIGKTVTINKELGEDSLDGAISRAAIAVATGFINSGFPHSWLADSGDAGAAGGGAGGGGGSGGDVEAGSAQTDAPCSTMSEVWKTAKCMNASDEPLFRKMTDLTDGNNDPRVYPKNMKCMNTGITQTMVDIAGGRDVRKDKVTTYLDMLKPQSGCYQQSFRTGVTVTFFEGSGRVAQQQTHEDGVCISPGCSLQRSGQCQ